MRVTIEGTATPSTFLARGERRTVSRTDFIDKLVRRGFVTIVEEHPDAATVLEAEKAEVAKRLQYAQWERQVTVVAPAETATKAEWKAFLDAQLVAYPESATKADLIARWENARG